MYESRIILLLVSVLASCTAIAVTQIYYDDGSMYTLQEGEGVYVDTSPLWTKTQSDDNIEFGKVTENSKRDGDDDPPPPTSPYCFGPLKPAASDYDCDLNGDVIGQDCKHPDDPSSNIGVGAANTYVSYCKLRQKDANGKWVGSNNRDGCVTYTTLWGGVYNAPVCVPPFEYRPIYTEERHSTSLF